MGRWSERRRWLALALVATIGVASCSDATSTAGDDESSTPTTAAVPEQYAGYTSDVYADTASWLCRPDTDDICDSDLDATSVTADGTTTVEPWAAADDPPIDCFYVYPTISRDETSNSDMVASPDEEGFAALNQVARLGSECRVFAPIHRQVTLGALISAVIGAGDGDADRDLAYDDVLDAWKQYMAHDNDGRGVVLIGHSQGAGLLRRLLAEEFDGDEQMRARLVSAFLAGGALPVPEGEDVGGAFDHIPLCRAETQTGCALAWSSFRDTSPPTESTLFGRVRDQESQTTADGRPLVAACVNPAALTGGSAELDAYFPASPDVSILESLGTESEPTGASWTKTATVTTPFAKVPGLVSGECASEGGVNYLSVHVNADPADGRADDIGGDLTPEWGLHLVDVNLVMGDIIELVRAQAAAYTAAA